MVPAKSSSSWVSVTVATALSVDTAISQPAGHARPVLEPGVLVRLVEEEGLGVHQTHRRLHDRGDGGRTASDGRLERREGRDAQGGQGGTRMGSFMVSFMVFVVSPSGYLINSSTSSMPMRPWVEPWPGPNSKPTARMEFRLMTVLLYLKASIRDADGLELVGPARPDAAARALVGLFDAAAEGGGVDASESCPPCRPPFTSRVQVREDPPSSARRASTGRRGRRCTIQRLRGPPPGTMYA
jgi:hypothetical protein